MSPKRLERLFQEQADKIGPCPLPDPKTKGIRKIEHIGLVRVEPQPAGWKYDEDDNDAENKRFLSDLVNSFQQGAILKKDLLKMKQARLITRKQYNSIVQNN